MQGKIKPDDANTEKQSLDPYLLNPLGWFAGHVHVGHTPEHTLY
jgi:hypothetical protein